MGQVPDKDVHGSVAVVGVPPRKRPVVDQRLDAAVAGLEELRRRFDSLERRSLADEMPDAPRCDACGGRLDAAADDRYPVVVELHLNAWADMSRFLDFLRYVKNTAAMGHSFEIGADTDAEPGRDGAQARMFGKQRCGASCYVDGDGPDRIGRIVVNGKELK